MASTLKIGRFWQGKTVCHYDELSPDTLINQIIYSTLIETMQLEGLERKNKERIAKVIQKFPQTQRIRITEQSFHCVRLQRNNRYYQFVLNVCQLLFNSMLPDESKQGMKEFVNIMDDERQMNLIFERFLLNFCKQECKESYPVVGRSHIHFQLTPTAMTFVRGTDEALELLPVMETDVTLYNPQTGKKTILDAKYYHETLVSKYGSKGKIRREHLSQIITYVMNQEDDNVPHTKDTAGILIYPTIDKDIDVSYNYKNTNHTIRVCTVNLNQGWQLIENRLKERFRLLAISSPVARARSFTPLMFFDTVNASSDTALPLFLILSEKMARSAIFTFLPSSCSLIHDTISVSMPLIAPFE